MLALVGSGEYLEPIEELDRTLMGRLKGEARVVCLPTAAGTEGEERIAYWSRLGVEHFTRLGAQVEAMPVIDRASANDEAIAQTIAQANFVYLSGGKPDYLYGVLKGSRSWEAIESVLAAGGILAGCSAGAMIMGEKFFGFPGWKQGFNFLPQMTIIPHYDEIPEGMLATIRPIMGRGLTLLGIEGYTALVKNGGSCEVLGSGGVTIWNKNGKTRYTQGPLPLTFS
ncbi:MAG TPA: Type 1 glutamine amidotransferase-like domain-containing protein [Aggregatilineales bacterium]|nr:Type 1 glutamine amidotransferase-like domain-containing protein [Aggregatilineales bacterium]